MEESSEMDIEDILVQVLIWVSVIVLMFFVYGQARWRLAKYKVFKHVKSYRVKCTGTNRFVVTPETLAEVFPEYNEGMIYSLWIALMEDKVIEQHIDGEWCVK